MRWGAFLTLATAVLIIQIGIIPPLGLGPQRIVPDLMLMLAVVLALRAEKNPALLACWLIGLLKDLTGQAPAGCNAFAYGLAAGMIVSIRDYLYGSRPVVLMMLTGFLSFATQAFEIWLILFKQGAVLDSFRPALMNIVFTALFSAALAPYMNWLVVSLHYQLGLPGRRR